MSGLPWLQPCEREKFATGLSYVRLNLSCTPLNQYCDFQRGASARSRRTRRGEGSFGFGEVDRQHAGIGAEQQDAMQVWAPTHRELGIRYRRHQHRARHVECPGKMLDAIVHSDEIAGPLQ